MSNAFLACLPYRRTGGVFGRVQDDHAFVINRKYGEREARDRLIDRLIRPSLALGLGLRLGSEVQRASTVSYSLLR